MARVKKKKETYESILNDAYRIAAERGIPSSYGIEAKRITFTVKAQATEQVRLARESGCKTSEEISDFVRREKNLMKQAKMYHNYSKHFSDVERDFMMRTENNSFERDKMMVIFKENPMLPLGFIGCVFGLFMIIPLLFQ